MHVAFIAAIQILPAHRNTDETDESRFLTPAKEAAAKREKTNKKPQKNKTLEKMALNLLKRLYR